MQIRTRTWFPDHLFLRYNLFTIIWASLLFLLVMLPGSNMPDMDLWSFISFDKFAHFFFFSVLTFLMIIGFAKQYTFQLLRNKPIWVSVAITLSYGMIIELIQLVIPGRAIEYLDVVANMIGIGFGVTVFYLVYKV